MEFSPVGLLHALCTDMLALNYLSNNSLCLIVNLSDIISFNRFNLSRRHFNPTTPFPLYLSHISLHNASHCL